MNIDTTALDALFDNNPDIARGLAAAYETLIGGVPSIDGFTFLINQATSTNFGSNSSAVFNPENIYINLFNGLVQGNSAATAAFSSIAGSGSLSAQITALYNSFVPEASRTTEGLAFFNRADATAFYSAAALERGITSTNGPAIIAAAAILQVAVRENIPGVGNSVNDLVSAVNSGTSMLTQSSNSVTPIETADGSSFDSEDETGANSLDFLVTNITEGGNGASDHAQISDDGQIIAFLSRSTNLSTNDPDLGALNTSDLFVFRAENKTFTNVTGSFDRIPGTDYTLSSNGKFIVFESRATNITPVFTENSSNSNIYIYDVDNSSFQNLTNIPHNTTVRMPSVSSDGNFVSFDSGSSNIVEDDNNNNRDIFLLDRSTGIHTNITLGGKGFSKDAVVTDDGEKVIFISTADNLMPGQTAPIGNYIYSYDISSKTFDLLVVDPFDGISLTGVSASADGSKITFQSSTLSLISPIDTDRVSDVFLYDVTSNNLISITATGDRDSFDPKISGDGSTIVFSSKARNLVPDTDIAVNSRASIEVFSYDIGSMKTMSLTGFSPGIGASSDPTLTGNGKMVLFDSVNSNLTIDDVNFRGDIFLHTFL